MRVFEFYRRPVLVTRASARAVADMLEHDGVDAGEVSLDFEGVEAVTPSFFDELIGVLESRLGNQEPFSVKLVNFPTRFSSKYAAIARGRHVKIEELRPGRWEISREPN